MSDWSALSSNWCYRLVIMVFFFLLNLIFSKEVLWEDTLESIFCDIVMILDSSSILYISSLFCISEIWSSYGNRFCCCCLSLFRVTSSRSSPLILPEPLNSCSASETSSSYSKKLFFSGVWFMVESFTSSNILFYDTFEIKLSLLRFSTRFEIKGDTSSMS